MENKEVVETVATDQETGTEGQEQGQTNEQEKDLDQKKTDPKPQKTYSQEDVDRIVAHRLSKERKKLDRLLNPEENDLDKREREITKRELRAEAKERLLKDGLPLELSDIFDLSDKDMFESSYKVVSSSFKTAFQKAVEEKAKEYFSGTGPKKQSGSSSDPIAEAFRSK